MLRSVPFIRVRSFARNGRYLVHAARRATSNAYSNGEGQGGLLDRQQLIINQSTMGYTMAEWGGANGGGRRCILEGGRGAGWMERIRSGGNREVVNKLVRPQPPSPIFSPSPICAHLTARRRRRRRRRDRGRVARPVPFRRGQISFSVGRFFRLDSCRR